MKAVEVNTGDGLVFTVLPDRGMDIGAARFRNIPVSLQSKVGVVSPKFLKTRVMNGYGAFMADCSATCGLSTNRFRTAMHFMGYMACVQYARPRSD